MASDRLRVQDDRARKAETQRLDVRWRWCLYSGIARFQESQDARQNYSKIVLSNGAMSH